MRGAMRTHLKEMAEDTRVYGWEVVRTFHKVYLSSIEKGRFTWVDRPEALVLRTKLVWCRMPKGRGEQSQGSATLELVCYAFNKGRCNKNGDHPGDKPGTVFKHICRSCKKQGVYGRHTELACQKRPAKNDSPPQ